MPSDHKAAFLAAVGAQPLDSDLTAFAAKTAPSGAVVGTTDTQTLTNKTLTAPAISSPTGIVKGDVGLGNVDNTADTAKPVSTAAQAALNGKWTTYSLANYAGWDATGATDSTGAWNLAIAAAGAAPGNRQILIPRGTPKGNFVLTNAQANGHWRIIGEGAGCTGDWTAVEAAGATLIRPNNNAEPVFKFEFLRGVSIENLEIRGNGAGTSATGILIDNPSAAFAGNGFYAKNVTIRGFTNGFYSIGGCNIVFRESGIFNCNTQIRIPDLALAHSYLFEQCSLGGLATVLSGSGASRILDIADGSFVDFVNCEMGNCTDMISMSNAGRAPIINVRGGNMESMSATVLNTMLAGTFNMHGTRIGTGNKTVLRADGGTGEILGVNIENNNAQGTMTLYEHRGVVDIARLSGNGRGKLVSEYNTGFTVLQGTSVCEKLVVSARLTADQVVASGVVTAIFNVESADTGGKHNTTTGEFAPGKRGNFRFTANMQVNSGTAAPQVGVYINGNLRAILGQFVTSGGAAGTFVGGSAIVPMAASDVATIRVNSTGLTIQSNSNYTSTMAIEEIPYFN